MSIAVSIIVPVYNVQNYIKRCLDSIYNQTFKDYELIIVNDGSKDQSIDIIKSLAHNFDGKINIIDKKNGGLSSARNRGIEEAQGKYIVFVDSDDFIEDTMIEELYNKAQRESSDIVICGVIKYFENEKTQYKDVMKYDESMNYNSYDCVKKFLLNLEVDGYAWNKIYKSELFKNTQIRFPEGKLYEDVETTLQLICKAKSISFLDKYLYYYVQREGSITKNIKVKTISDYVRSIMRVKEIIIREKMYDKLKLEYEAFLVNRLNISYVMCRMYRSTNENTLEFKKIYKEIENLFSNISSLDVIRNVNIIKKDKIKVLLEKTKLIKLVKR